MLRGWVVLSLELLMHRQTRYYYLRNAWKSLWMGPAKFIFAHQLMGSYLHFARQTDRMIQELDVSIEYAQTQATYPRSVSDSRLQTDRRLPVHS